MNRYESPISLLHVDEQVQDLRLYRQIERRNRLVADDELGIEDERARDGDTLALSAGELVRKPLGSRARQADAIDHLCERGCGGLPVRQLPCTVRGARRISATRWRGLSEPNGS